VGLRSAAGSAHPARVRVHLDSCSSVCCACTRACSGGCSPVGVSAKMPLTEESSAVRWAFSSFSWSTCARHIARWHPPPLFALCGRGVGSPARATPYLESEACQLELNSSAAALRGVVVAVARAASGPFALLGGLRSAAVLRAALDRRVFGRSERANLLMSLRGAHRRAQGAEVGRNLMSIRHDNRRNHPLLKRERGVLRSHAIRTVAVNGRSAVPQWKPP
jgi:hypothetical protein